MSAIPSGPSSEKNESSYAMFSNPMRRVVAVVLILLSLGQLTGRIFSVNAINTQALEQTLRTDLLDELKYLTVLGLEEGRADDVAIYEEALFREFKFNAQSLKTPEAAKDAKAAKAKATRRWPIQARRENWESRKKEWTTANLLKKVLSETKYRREDLLWELKLLAIEASEAKSEEDQSIYLQTISTVLQDIANEKNKQLKKENPEVSDEQLVKAEVFDPRSLQDPAVIEEVKAAKRNASHHWPIELRRRDSENVRTRGTEAELVKMAIMECNKQRPFLSGNDRSRWLTVRSLVEHGTYEINRIIENEPAWDSVDIVSHRNAEGEQKLYSSKPPLQASIVAIPYWIMNQATGWTLGSHPFEVGRVLLFLVNVLPLGFAWWLAARLLDEWCESDACYVVLLASICFATLLSTFAVALNNHLWGAVSAIAASWYATRCWQNNPRTFDFLATGFWAAFAFTCELPAASLIAMFGLLLLVRAPKPTLAFGLPMVALVLVAYFGTNYIAHGKWSPPYSYGAGDVNTADSRKEENWYDFDYIRFMDGKKVDSYWRKPDNPLDLGEPSVPHYLFHATVGHHGILSLTPLLILAIPGMLIALVRGKGGNRLWTIAVIAVSVVCLAFYLFLLDTRQRNYGGTTTAFRQLLWLHPLWLIGSAPVVDRLMRSRLGTSFVGLLAGLSMLSVSYPTWNPWTQTWIWNLMLWLGVNPLSQ